MGLSDLLIAGVLGVRIRHVEALQQEAFCRLGTTHKNRMAEAEQNQEISERPG
jgi:hypothetical protein